MNNFSNKGNALETWCSASALFSEGCLWWRELSNPCGKNDVSYCACLIQLADMALSPLLHNTLKIMGTVEQPRTNIVHNIIETLENAKENLKTVGNFQFSLVFSNFCPIIALSLPISNYLEQLGPPRICTGPQDLDRSLAYDLFGLAHCLVALC